MEDDKSVKPKQPPFLPSNYVTIVELKQRWVKEPQRKEREKQDQERMMQKEREPSEKQFSLQKERQRKQKETRDQERMMQEVKERSEKRLRLPKERHSNYVTIVDLRERWVKEREQNEKEKQDQTRRMREEKEWSEKQLRLQKEIDTKKVELAPGYSNRRFPPSNNRNAVVEHGSLGQEEAAKIEEKFENLSLKGVNREISVRATGPRIGGSRMHVALPCVPNAKILPVNEGKCHGTKPHRYGGTWMKRSVDSNVNADKVLVCDQSGSNPSINLGNRMQRNVIFDEKLEKVAMCNARGRSNTNITTSKEMNRNVNVDGKLVKVLTSGAREGSTSSNGSNRMDGTVGIDGKFKIVPTVGANSSSGDNKVNKNLHSEGKCEEVTITARGRSYSRVEMNGFKRVGYHDRPEMVWVKKGEVCDGNAGLIQNPGF